MGLIQKRDERDVIDGIEVIGRGEGPDGLEQNSYDLVPGQTAEDISGTTAARNADMETEPDPELLDGIEAGTEGSRGEPEADADAADAEGEPEAKGAGEEDEGASKPHHALRRRKHAAKDAPSGKDEEAGPVNPVESTGHSGRGRLFVAIAVVAVIAAGIIGYVVGSGGIGAKGTGSAALTEGQLDTTVASWSYNGASHNLTAREAIESQYKLDAVKDEEDGTYAAPSADSILTYVRNQVMLEDAKARGIEVSDDELGEYAENALGTSDFEAIAEQYQVDEDQAKDIIRQQAVIQELYGEIIPDADEAPEAPAEPADGNEDAASKDYADYIIGLAGDEWDAEKGAWASEDGAIASALKDEGFSADAATYAQAQTAYYAAYQQYAQDSQDASAKWTEYANELFANAQITLYGLFA